MPRKLRVLLSISIAFLPAILPARTFAAQDPVVRFIAAADSLERAGASDALGNLVDSNRVLVGAAVGQLLDASVAAGDKGDEAPKRDMALAETLARLYQRVTGSKAPLELVTTYRGWKAPQRTLRSQAKELEKGASAAQKAGDLEKALGSYREARRIYEHIGDQRSLAVVWGTLGVVQWSRGDMSAVRVCYDSALVARRRIEDRILEGRTLNGLGSVSFMTGDYAAALGFYRDAADLRRKTGDIAGLGVSLTYLGNTYGRLGRLADAKDSYREAIDVLGSAGTSGQMIDALNGMASVNSEMGQLSLSDVAYADAIRLAAASGQADKESSCRLNLADNLRTEGRFREALAELDTLRALIDAAPDTLRFVEFRRNRGLTYLAMGEMDQARQDLVACYEMAGALDDPLHSIEALINLGYLYRDMGALAEGLSCADRARARADEAGNIRMRRDALALAADIERQMGRYEESLAHWRMVLDRDALDGFTGEEIQDRLTIANLLALQGKSAEARAAFGEAADAARSAGRGDLEWALHLGIGHSYERENPDSAYSHYERAFGLLERSRESLGGAELRTGFLSGDRRRLFEEIARYYASLSTGAKGDVWTARSFSTIEKGKARGLLDLLGRSVGVQSSPAEEALLDSIYRLDPHASGYAERENAMRNRYLDLRDARLASSLGSLGGGRGISGLAAVEKELGDGTALLEYALGDTVSFLWAVDRDGCEIFRLPPRPALVAEVERLRDAVAQPGAGDELFRKTARSLYRELVDPASRRIAHARRLVIIPDGVLFDLPFDALLAAEPRAGKDWKNQPFVAAKWSTIYCPSASVYVVLEEKGAKKSYARELLAMGNADFSGLPAGEWGALQPLAYSAKEVEGIGARLDPAREAAFTGVDASEARFKAEIRGSSTRIVHLATHGLVDPVEPMLSCVALSAGGSPPEDGLLHTLEILSLPVDAGLVVMSACESARGTIGRGEGVVGLSRAFIGAGARGVVASLWSVSDVSTAQLMQRLYGSMFKGKTPACDALRKARAALLEDPQFAHPFYWSPFIVIGTERTPW